MIFALFSVMIISGLLSLTGIVNYLLFLPFIIWTLQSLRFSASSLIIFSILLLYITFHFIIIGGSAIYFIQYIMIFALSFACFERRPSYAPKIAPLIHLTFLLVFLFLIASYHYLDLRLMNVNTSGFLLILYLLIFYKSIGRLSRKFWFLGAWLSLSRTVWLIYLIYAKFVKQRKLYVVILALIIFGSVPWWFYIVQVDKETFTLAFDFIRFKAGGGSSDFRRFFYYPEILMQSIEATGGTIWLGEGLGRRSYVNMLERKSDGLHNAFLIIASDIGFIGVLLLVSAWVFQCLRYFDYVSFIKFFVLFSALAFTPVIFGMPGILIALRFVGDFNARKSVCSGSVRFRSNKAW